MQKSTFKIPIFILIVSTIVSIVVILSLKSSWDTWVYQKSIYKDLIKLIGKVSANEDNVVELKKLKTEFDGFYGGEMIFAEANDKELLHRMMVLQKDYEDHILGRSDYYQPKKLKQSCLKLVKQLRKSISDNDFNYLLKVLTPLMLGMVSVFIYFLYRFIKRKAKDKILRTKLSPQSINKIKEIISEGKTDAALHKLNSLLGEDDFSKIDELVLLNAKFKKTVKDRNLDLIDSDEQRLEISRINKAILDTLNAVT